MKRTGLIGVFIVLLSLSGADAALSQSTRSQSKFTGSAPASPSIILPNKDDSVRFAVIGDVGTGAQPQRQLAEVLVRAHALFPFEFALLLGDNLYGGEGAQDYVEKFEQPYKPLIDAKLKFYGSLGNHDNSNQRFYKHFNMDGKEYYSFKKGNIRFFALNSNYMDGRQIEWLEKELANKDAEWKVAFFHHPLYSSGRKHGSDTELRKVLEPLFVKHGLQVAFTGHEHFYERLKPQKGIHYFISGAGGKLRPGDVKSTKMTAKSYDQDLHFMLVEVTGDEMHFQVISRTGKTIDSGVINRVEKAQTAAGAQ